jgi:choline dehydrogenase-like flavoprotein
MLLEMGKEDPLGLGPLHTYMNLYEKHLIFNRSKEGIIIDRSLTLGGSSAVYSGNAFRPTQSLQAEMGMDMNPTVEETIDELGIAPFSNEFMAGWTGTNRIIEACDSLGVNMKPQLKFINPEICFPKCDSCMQGCAINARWTARDYVRKAQAWPRGADLIMETKVEKVLIDKATNKAIGVRVKGPKGTDEYYAPTIILAAGGMSTPVILQRSGIEEAGKAFFLDPMDILVGFIKEKGPWRGMTFTHACEDFEEDEHFIIGNAGGVGSWLLQMLRPKTMINQLMNFGNCKNHAIGMFTKIGDENQGYIDARGRISKPMTERDMKAMKRGDKLCTEIMIKAGCDPDSISIATMVGGHPGGTAALGKVVNENWETRVKNLYVCDTSVFPRSPGLPPVLTLIAMVKKWARELDV